MDQPKLERLLRVMKLLTTNNRYTVADIARKLNTSVRTVYRYIDTFREAGFVIKRNGNYVKIDRSSPYFKDISQLVHFTDEEAYILKRAIESIDETNLLKENLKKKLYSVYDYKVLADIVVKGKNASNVHNLIEAIENKKQVVLCNYNSAHSGNIADRVVEPFAFTTNYIQVWAYDSAISKNRLFRLSRIENVELLDSDWQHESSHKQGFIDVFRVNSDIQLPIKLKLNLRAMNLLIEEFPLAEQYLTQVGDKEWLLETHVSRYDGVGRFVMGLLEDIEILEPLEFKEFIKTKGVFCLNM